MTVQTSKSTFVPIDDVEELTVAQKLALLNSLPRVDYASGVEVDYVMVEDNEQSREVLRKLGSDDAAIELLKFHEHADEESTLDIAMIGWEIGATQWHPTSGFTVGEPKQTEKCEMCGEDTGSTDLVCDPCHEAEVYADPEGCDEVA